MIYSYIWWTQDFQLIEQGFSHTRAHESFWNGLQTMDGVWDMESHQFVLWQEAHEKFGLLGDEFGAWDVIMGANHECMPLNFGKQ